MRVRFVVPLICASLGLTSVGCQTDTAAQGTTEESASSLVARDYYPLRVGNRWTYKAEPGAETRVIEIVREEDGFFVDNNTPPSRLQQRSTGIFDGDRFLLEDPLEIGHQWIAVPSAATVERYEIVAVGLELSTPAGFFKHCVRVKAEAPGRTEDGQQMTLLVFWTYAPDVGLIRIEQRVQLGNGPAKPQMRIELVKYELGSPKP